MNILIPQHLQSNQRQNPPSLRSLPPPLLSSTSRSRTSSSEDEVVFQGEEGKKTYPLRNKGQRDWYSEIEREESSRPPQNKGRPGLTPTKQPLVTSTRSFSGPTSYGMVMVQAAKTKKKGAQPQGYVQTVSPVTNFYGPSLSKAQAPRLRKVTSNARRNVPSRPPTRGVLRDAEMDTVQVDIATVQIGRLTDVNVISPAELSGTDLTFNMDIEDKTHKAIIWIKDIAEWKMNLSAEPLLITLKLREGPAKALASRLSTKFHLDAKFYSPFSGDESERFIILHVRDTPLPHTIVVLNEILDNAKASSTMDMVIEREFPPPEAAKLLQRVKPSKIARTQLKDPDFSIRSVGVDYSQAPRRSSRIKRGEGRSAVGEDVVKRKKGNPNKQLLAYKPAGSRVNLEIMESDLDCLYPGEYLNDKIIDFYLMYLYYELLAEEHRNRIHIFSSFFHTRLRDSSRDNHELGTPERIHDRVKTWTRHVDLFSKDYIVLPVCDRSHWFVAFICHPGLFDPDMEPRSHPRPRKTPQARSSSRRRSKRGRKQKTKTPIGAIVLSDSQDEGELPGGEEDGEAPLPGDGEGEGEECSGEMKGEGVGGVERVEEEELLDVSMEELNNWRDSCEEGEGVVPGAMLQEVVEKEERVTCVQTKSPPTTREGLDDSLDEVPDSQILMEECESVMEVECGDGEEDGMETKTDREEGAPGVDVPNSQDAVTLIDAVKNHQGMVESLGEEEEKDVTVCPSSSEEATKEPCIMVLDSLGVKRTAIVKRIRDYLTVEWRAKKHDLSPKLFDGMRASYPGVQLQDNSSDCGVFVLQYVESLLKSVKENQPLPSSPDAWASYKETNNKRTVIKSLITDFEKRRSQENKPTAS